MKYSMAIGLLMASFLLVAQDQDTTYWKTGGQSTLTFSQVSLTNWAGGGQNSASINGAVSFYGIRTKGRGKWENYFDASYGLIKQGDTDFDKSDDKLNIITKYGYQIMDGNKKWYFSGILDFKTQFDEGLDPADESILISDFMAPGYLVVGTGVDYFPQEKLSISYIPITGKFTFVTNQELADAGAYGVDGAVFADDGVTVLTPGKNSRAELGSFFRAVYKNDVFESRLELFTNYMEDFGNIDVNWQNALVVNFTKVLSTNFFTQLIYDDDVKIEVDDNDNGVIDVGESKPRLQFKSVIGVGLTYKFGGARE